MKQTIREITDNELSRSARVIRDSFRTVAAEFGLTRENSPTHPSFTTVRQLRKLKDKGLMFFGLFLDDRQVGFVAIEKADNKLYYMEKLAVLPGYRHKGCGTGLVRFVFDYVQERDGKTLSIWHYRRTHHIEKLVQGIRLQGNIHQEISPPALYGVFHGKRIILKFY